MEAPVKVEDVDVDDCCGGGGLSVVFLRKRNDFLPMDIVVSLALSLLSCYLFRNIVNVDSVSKKLVGLWVLIMVSSCTTRVVDVLLCLVFEVVVCLSLNKNTTPTNSCP